MSSYPTFDFEKGEILLFDKPLTWTSFDVVNKVRSTIKCKKVGHAGTLDPLATGLLVLCTGKKTKIVDQIQAQEKEYLTKIVLGKTTPSFDSETEFDSTSDISHISPEEVEKVINSFVGEQEQIPPLYSAIKVGGDRLYKLARKGKEIEIRPRKIFIYSIENVKINLPEVEFLLRCSKGTYVRSLARDIGVKLGVGGYLSSLRRTKVGDFKVEEAYDLASFVRHFQQLNNSQK